MSRTIVGRERELAVLSEFLEGIADRPPALAIEGDAGAGKTTLWLEGLRLADTVGVRVLRAQPAGAEAKLSFAALGDLLRDVADGAGSLPAPQGKALRAALLLEKSAAAAPDAHAVALATLAVLRQTGASGPTLLAIDDVQWLDAPSAQALAFALRRLDAVPIGVLTARRRSREPRIRSRSSCRFPSSGGSSSGLCRSTTSTACCASGSERASSVRRSAACTRRPAEIPSSRSSSRGRSPVARRRSSRARRLATSPFDPQLPLAE